MKLLSLFRRRSLPAKSRPNPDTITIVSGLPRSGTSMLMQILQAGGMPILTDQMRAADDDNPKGYYELERVKKLKDGDVEWVKEARGKAVKIISALLEYLPQQYTYKIIFVHRKMEEILASQKQMLIRRGEPTDKIDDEALAAYFHQHLAALEKWLANQPNMQVLYIHYDNLLQDPKTHIAMIAKFIDRPLDFDGMLVVPDKSLHRQRR